MLTRFVVLVAAVLVTATLWAITRETFKERSIGDHLAHQVSRQSPRIPPSKTFSRIFEPCAHCHEIGDGARQSAGPILNDIIGRKAASEPYPYSKAMRDSGLTWTEEVLRRFIRSPGEVVPGTRMVFGGLPDEKIGPLIDFLKSGATHP